MIKMNIYVAKVMNLKRYSKTFCFFCEKRLFLSKLLVRASMGRR